MFRETTSENLTSITVNMLAGIILRPYIGDQGPPIFVKFLLRNLERTANIKK